LVIALHDVGGHASPSHDVHLAHLLHQRVSQSCGNKVTHQTQQMQQTQQT